MYKEDDYLMLSGIQHFCFCRRQWALIHIEQQWAENNKTTEGLLLHKNAHSENKSEKRGNLIIMRGLHIKSDELKVTGVCDVVEFHKTNDGIRLNNYGGLWQPYPVEYKNGLPKNNESDILQICGQAMCLEEMLACEIPYGAIYYGKIQRRVEVEFSDNIRERVKSVFEEMRRYWEKGWTPKGIVSPGCNSCSLADVCIPQINCTNSVQHYIKGALEEYEETS